MLLGHMLHKTRWRQPDHIALWFGERRWTYAELDDVSDRVAASLAAAGVQAGERVAVFLPNCPELLFTYLACFKLGAIAVPLNYRYKQDEARYALEHSASTTLITHPMLAAEVAGLPFQEMGITRCYQTIRAAPPFQPFDSLLAGDAPVPETTFDERQPTAILYTSGSTARPKGVTYTHASLVACCQSMVATFDFTADDVHLMSTAACHAAAFTGQFLPNLLAGGTAVLTHLPKPEAVVKSIARHRVSRIQMLPASLADLVEHLEQNPRSDLGSLKVCTAGGDVVPHDLFVRFKKVLGFDITELCGMTEALSYMTNPPFGEKKIGSIGQPAAGYEVRVVDDAGQDTADGQEGEIIIQGAAMMDSYWNDPEATARTLRDGWLYSGDLGKRDEEGWFWFVGRKKEIIIRGGSNISPLEVEEVIDEHPAVHLSCVVGVPDAHLGERVAAYVAYRADIKKKPSAEELRRFVAERIAAYKVPELITVMKDMPLNASGKVDRKKLHQLVKKK